MTEPLPVRGGGGGKLACRCVNICFQGAWVSVRLRGIPGEGLEIVFVKLGTSIGSWTLLCNQACPAPFHINGAISPSKSLK